MLQKQAIDISFAQGLDLKTDPFRVQPGKFLALQNSIFDKGGQLQKRNGFKALSPLPSQSASYLTTFNGNLTALGTTLESYSSGNATWIDKGPILPVDLATLPVVRNGYYQSQADSVVAANGLACVAYTEYTPVSGVLTPTHKYIVIDSITGQNIVAPTLIPNADATYGTPRVFLLGNYFIILYTSHTSGYNLQYIAVGVTTPTNVSLPTTVAVNYTPTADLSFDGTVVNDTLYIGYNTTSGGQSIKVTSLSQSLIMSATRTYAGSKATSISVTADNTTLPNPIIYISFYDSVSTNGHVLAVYFDLSLALAPTQFITGEAVVNLTSVAQNGICTVFYEVANTYSYGSNLETNYVKTNTITFLGVVGTSSIIRRSVGLASKAFLYNSNPYVLTIYSSDYQPTYFLLDNDGTIISKLAYSNGGQYYTTGLPNTTLIGNSVTLPYLYKDQIQAANKTQGIADSAGVYAQLGVNLVTFNFQPSAVVTSEIGSNLNYTGGYLSMYDGVKPVEQGFFLWPDNIGISSTTLSPVTSGGTTVVGSTTISGISTTGIYIGDGISGTGIPTGALVAEILPSTIIMDMPATAAGTNSFSFTSSLTAQQYFYQVTYEWTDNQGNLFRSAPSIPVGIDVSTDNAVILNIPTLRLTYKTNVSIVVYRWSTAQQNYYQVTSITSPLLNDPTVDSITFTDTNSDANILGNNLIYTTGGVIENIAPPATDLITLFNNRLWLLDAEDRNLLWFSKQVIEATPVEMSDLLTLYVAPTTASEGSTGPITAISPMDDKLIIFKQNALGYINGIGPDNTGSNSQYSDFNLINSVVGCTNQNSIVFMPQGLMFQSNKGIWLVGRDLSTQYIGAPVESLTAGTTVLSAINVPATNQVRFTLTSGITLIYDYYYSQWGTFVNVPAISSTIYQELHTFINSYGQVFQESVGSYLDGSNPVLMSFTTGWMNLAGVQGFERFYQMYLLGQYLSPFNLNVQIAYDYNPSPIQATLVSPSQTPVSWGSDAQWGSGSTWGSQGSGGWEGQANVFEARVFPQRQKCEAFQITINEVYNPAAGGVAGAGLTLTGLNLVVGMKRGFRTSKASRNFG